MAAQKNNVEFYDLQSQAKCYMQQLQMLQTSVAF